MIQYLAHIAVMVSLFTILALSFNLVFGLAGLDIIMPAAFLGVGSYAAALSADLANYEMLFTVTIGAVAASVLGVVVGLTARRVRDYYLVVVSIGIHMVVFFVFVNWVSVTNGHGGIRLGQTSSVLGLPVQGPIPYLVVFFIAAVASVLVTLRIHRSPYGRILKAIREDESVAEVLGKDPAAAKFTIVLGAAALAGAAGALYAHYLEFVSPLSFDIHQTLLILIAVIVGGVGSVRGSVAGAVLLVTLPEALRYVELSATVAGSVQRILFGLGLIVVLIWRPRGLFHEHVGESLLGITPFARFRRRSSSQEDYHAKGHDT